MIESIPMRRMGDVENVTPFSAVYEGLPQLFIFALCTPHEIRLCEGYIFYFLREHHHETRQLVRAERGQLDTLQANKINAFKPRF